jgi:hypothetical protein
MPCNCEDAIATSLTASFPKVDAQEKLTFEIFIYDDRYSVPTLHLFSATDEAEARDVAAMLLNASVHHVGVELCRNDRRIVRLGTCPERRVF